MNSFKREDIEKRTDDLKTVDFIFSTWGMPRFEGSFIAEYMPNLKVLFYGAGSVQGFAREFLEENRIVVSAWGANAVPVAEFTVSQIMLATKGFFQRFKHTSTDKWDNRKNTGYFPGNYNTKVGIIGAGMVGRAVIKLLNNHMIDIYVYDPFLPDDAASALGVKKQSLEYIFAECFVISNHLANNEQTKGMLDGKLFSLMQENAAFINTGRGAQVVEKDLAHAMREKPNRIALLDVTDPEPPQDGSDLYKLGNVFLSPHIAGGIGDEVQRMGEYMYNEFCAYLDGRPLSYTVSLDMLATMA
ncbi:MAG: hydroxyacid dehydrogenase [Eubacteriales bacterium]|nr:hydroxyacid dehydrogenase [Eubacteriales bacterium]